MQDRKEEEKSWNRKEKQKEKVDESSKYEKHLETLGQQMKKWSESGLGKEPEENAELAHQKETSVDCAGEGINYAEDETDVHQVERQDSEIVSGELDDQKSEAPKKERGLYNYTPLDFEKKEMRFLILKPHPDDPGSFSDLDLVECSFSFTTLAESEPYTYVVNTRGNPLAWFPISIDGPVIWITRNIAVFLNHIRSKENSQRLWFRDVCLDSKNAEEKSHYWNPEWMDTMIKHAENVVDLSEVMGELLDQGQLPKPFSPRPKDWLGRREPIGTKHHPAPIEMQVVGENITLPHKYLPLDYVLDEFRLITLWKAEKFSDPLRASLAYTVLHDDTTYHALSYTWGIEEATCPILLNNQTSLIRKNLDSFLRNVRHDSNRFVVWVDAICIDQNNIMERNRQLSRMLEIFKGADCVISWLGEADDASERALNYLDELNKSVVLRKTNDGDWDVENSDAFPIQLAALYRLFLRPYFRRVWVVQELAMASLPAIFCGESRVTGDSLDTAAYHLLEVLHSDVNMPGRMMDADPQLKSVSYRDISFVRRLFYIRHLQGRGHESTHWRHTVTDWLEIGEHSPGILDVVVMCRDFESTSPYDKVFALWNLARDTENMTFRMDYTRSLSDTWLDFATTVAEGNGSLDIICAAEPIVRAGLDIPSWCPDWSTPSTASSLIRRENVPNIFMHIIKDQGGPVYFAAGKGDLEPRFKFDGRILECAGLITDTVRLVGPNGPDLPRRTIFMDWLNIVCEEFALNVENEPYTDTLSAFWSMLAGDVTGVWGMKELPQSRFPSTEAGTPYHNVCFKPENCRHRLHNTVADVHGIVTRGRRLIVTENGYMGLAPHYAEVGQCLAVLNCCSVPVLLRENENGTYQFVGSCFVQGWMEGEMVDELGPTPEEVWEGVDLSGRLTIV